MKFHHSVKGPFLPSSHSSGPGNEVDWLIGMFCNTMAQVN